VAFEKGEEFWDSDKGGFLDDQNIHCHVSVNSAVGGCLGGHVMEWNGTDLSPLMK
jgi:hypothetical protein